MPIIIAMIIIVMERKKEELKAPQNTSDAQHIIPPTD